MNAVARWRTVTGLALALLSGTGMALAPADLAPLDRIVQDEIRAGHIPGAVVLVGQGKHVLYRKAFGHQALQPEREPMRLDTVFDLASLTKAVVTTTALLQLAERGLVELDAPAARYWPAFAARAKQDITIRQLLAHSSGLPAGIDPGHAPDPAAVYERIAGVKPLSPPGLGVRYSDVNFAALGKIVARTSGQRLDRYAEQHIFEPLDMKHTRYRPPAAWHARIAPTSPDRRQRLRRGEVHDPLASALDGVAGHAGLFGTADDLARFARDLLARHGRLLEPATVRAMLSPQTPPGSPLRGLGWRLDPPLSSNRAALPSAGAASHYGFTGTALWLDPVSGTYMIALSNRLHPDERGDAGPLRARLANALGEALGSLPAAELARRRPELGALLAPYIPREVAEPVLTGIDVLEARHFKALRGKRIALLTHRSGVDSHGRRTADVLRAAPGVTLAALLSPEHGLDSLQEGQVRNGSDALTGVPIYSLYGASKRPAPDALRGLDAVVVDLQDAGTRFYTYATTLAYLMEAAGAEGIPVYVLDRPNPLGAAKVQGPMLDVAQRGFTGYWPLPTRHGMTLGELARLFAGEAGIRVELHVVAMRNLRRGDWYDGSGLPWLAPSPNLPSVAAATLYPGVGMIEGAPVSVGRGTDTPFEVVGAPWIDGGRLAAALGALRLPGVRFAPATFTPATATHAGKTCHGVRVELTDRDALNSPALGVALAHTLHRMHPTEFQVDRILGNLGSAAVLNGIKAGETLPSLLAGIDRDVQSFEPIRARYLLY